MRGRLPVRLGLAPGETLHAYVLRLVEANGYRRRVAVLGAAGMPAGFASRPCALDGLSAAVGGLVTVAELERAASWPDASGFVRLGGARVPADVVSLSRPRICPSCLAQGKGLDPMWDVSGFSACPTHGTVMVDACACGLSLRWNRPGRERCDCGSTIRPAAEPAPAAALKVSATLLALARGEPSPFAPLPISMTGAFARLVRFVACDGDSPARWRANAMARPSVHDDLAAARRAVPVLDAWPVGWDAWLRAPGRFDGRGGSRPELPILARRLRAILSAPDMRDVLAQTRRSIAAGPHGPFVKPWAFLHAADIEATVLRGTPAARRLGVSPATLAGLVARGRVVGRTIPVGRRRTHVVDAEGVAAFASRRASALSATEVGRRLGVGPLQVAALQRAAVLPALGAAERGRGGARYGTKEPDALIDRLQRIAAPGPAPDDIPFSVVAGRRYAGFARLVSDAVEGRIHVRRAAGPVRSLADLYVAEREALVRRHRPRGDHLSVRDAARRLRLAVRMVPVLVRAGCLEAIPSTTGAVGKCGVTAASVEAFPRRYATARSHAAHWGTNTRTAIARLLREGHVPVVEADTARGVSSIWHRAAPPRAGGPGLGTRRCTAGGASAARRATPARRGRAR